MKPLCLLAALAVAAASAPAQSARQKKTLQQQNVRDELGLTCEQVLAMPSADYIAKYVAIDDSRVDGQMRGIGRFGNCYDERTARLAASLARHGHGPAKAALANLKDLERRVANLTATALADADPPADSLKSAYASLYQKQFRYDFYESYEEKFSKPAPKSPPERSPAAAPAAPSASSSASKSPAPSSAAPKPSPDLPAPPSKKIVTGLSVSSAAPASVSPITPPDESAARPERPVVPPPAPAPAPPPAAPSEASPAPVPSNSVPLDPFTKAKNHFGELLGSLPPGKLHEVHSSFGQLFEGNPVTEQLKLQLYQYAIFLLEPPSDKPFAPPPF